MAQNLEVACVCEQRCPPPSPPSQREQHTHTHLWHAPLACTSRTKKSARTKMHLFKLLKCHCSISLTPTSLPHRATRSKRLLLSSHCHLRSSAIKGLACVSHRFVATPFKCGTNGASGMGASNASVWMSNVAPSVASMMACVARNSQPEATRVKMGEARV